MVFRPRIDVQHQICLSGFQQVYGIVIGGYMDIGKFQTGIFRQLADKVGINAEGFFLGLIVDNIGINSAVNGYPQWR